MWNDYGSTKKFEIIIKNSKKFIFLDFSVIPILEYQGEKIRNKLKKKIFNSGLFITAKSKVQGKCKNFWNKNHFINYGKIS